MKLRLGHAPERLLCSYEKAIPNNRGTGQTQVGAEIVDMEEFKLGASLHDKSFPILTETEDPAVVGPR